MMNMKATGVLCEGCRAAESAVYCRVDAAYLCVSCDSRIHITALHHDRVRLCASCSYAPAVVLCKADSASLCVACDHKIHSANLLAARHHRVPIQPMTDAIPGPPRHTFTGSNIPESSDGGAMENDADEDDEEEAASWLLLNPPNGKANRNDGLRFGEFLELADFGSSPNLDQCNKEESNQKQEYNVHQRQFFQLGMKYEDPKAVDFVPASSFYSTPSMAPDTATQGSFSQTKQLRDDASDPFPGCAVDREARVLRYREKKKNRRFEKTIRYASRKAYAEVRPRIKGRFAKQPERCVQVTQV